MNTGEVALGDSAHPSLQQPWACSPCPKDFRWSPEHTMEDAQCGERCAIPCSAQHFRNNVEMWWLSLSNGLHRHAWRLSVDNLTTFTLFYPPLWPIHHLEVHCEGSFFWEFPCLLLSSCRQARFSTQDLTWTVLWYFLAQVLGPHRAGSFWPKPSRDVSESLKGFAWVCVHPFQKRSML